MTSAFQYELEQYINENKKYFHLAQLKSIETMIINSDKTMSEIKSLKLKSPTTAKVLSVCLGWLGVDRFIQEIT